MTFQILLLCIFVNLLEGKEYSYSGPTGPKHWAELFPKHCAGESQSPIDIDTSALTCQTPDFELHDYSNNIFRNVFKTTQITNNGHTAQVNGDGISAYLLTKFDDVDAKYDFAQYHFHWGPNANSGSEHTVDGKQYPLELHLVHINSKYQGTKEFANNADGITVLGILFELSPYGNPSIEPVINSLKYIQKAGSVRRISAAYGTTLAQLLPLNLSAYHYKGSLTTPECNEVVNWIVLKDKTPISKRQLAQFQLLRTGNLNSPIMTENYRPTQPLNGRSICSINGKVSN